MLFPCFQYSPGRFPIEASDLVQTSYVIGLSSPQLLLLPPSYTSPPEHNEVSAAVLPRVFELCMYLHFELRRLCLNRSQVARPESVRRPQLSACHPRCAIPPSLRLRALIINVPFWADLHANVMRLAAAALVERHGGLPILWRWPMALT